MAKKKDQIIKQTQVTIEVEQDEQIPVLVKSYRPKHIYEITKHSGRKLSFTRERDVSDNISNISYLTESYIAMDIMKDDEGNEIELTSSQRLLSIYEVLVYDYLLIELTRVNDGRAPDKLTIEVLVNDIIFFIKNKKSELLTESQKKHLRKNITIAMENLYLRRIGLLDSEGNKTGSSRLVGEYLPEGRGDERYYKISFMPMMAKDYFSSSLLEVNRLFMPLATKYPESFKLAGKLNDNYQRNKSATKKVYKLSTLICINAMNITDVEHNKQNGQRHTLPFERLTNAASVLVEEGFFNNMYYTDELGIRLTTKDKSKYLRMKKGYLCYEPNY